MNNVPGKLITFEGCEGCGKSTQIANMARHFENSGFDVVLTREPGGTPIGECIRHLLKHQEDAENMFPETELLLFAASRAQLVREVIQPAINDGKIVLCDRYLDSTTVYQGAARKLSDEPIKAINQFAVDGIMPDLTIILDVSPEVGFERIKKRRHEGMPDRMEQESIQFYRAVREGYLLLAQSVPGRFLVVDGQCDIKQIEKELWDVLSKRFIK